MVAAARARGLEALVADGQALPLHFERAFDAVARLEAPVKRALVRGLAARDGVTVFGTTDDDARVGTVALALRGVAPALAARALGDAGVCVAAGNFYAPLAMEAAGREADGIVRASIAHYTSERDVQRLLDAVGALIDAAK
jgi:selenocysteine lyase/cysteine desulfurase